MRNFFVRCQLLLLVVCVLASPASARETLRVLAWPGYADADIVKRFEQQTGSKVDVTYVDSDLDLWQKMGERQGQDFDVLALNTAELQRYISHGLVAPINRSAIPQLAKQLPRFKQPTALPAIFRGAQQYAVPYTYAEMGLIYDRKQVPTPPTSLQALWDTKYKGKVLTYNGASHGFSIAAQSLGWSSPFHIREADWPVAVDRLIELRRNVAAFYTHPEESADLFQHHQAALMLANYGTQQLKLLQAAGLDVAYTVPKEGALAWLDCWAISRGAVNVPLAHTWINHMLSPAAGDALLKRQGLANTTSESPFFNPKTRLIWLEPVEDEERRAQMWGRIVAGDRASKVLYP